MEYLPPEPVAGSWQHFAFVASQAGNYMRIFRNGVLEASRVGMTPFVRGGEDFLIGALLEDTGQVYLLGTIDEFRIWSVARTEAEIATNLHRRLSGAEPGLLAYYRFDEGAGASTPNLASGSGVGDGILTNGAEWTISTAPIFDPNLANDCNANGILDACEGSLVPIITAHPQTQSACPGDSVSFSVIASSAVTPGYQWTKDGEVIAGATGSSVTINPVSMADAGDYRVIVSGACGSAASEVATLSVLSDQPPPRLAMTALCPAATITAPKLFGFTDDGPATGNRCAGQIASRLFSGREGIASGQIWRVRQNCTAQAFGSVLCTPESVLVDRQARWPGGPFCTLPNLLIVGGCDTISFVNPSNGVTCGTYYDPTFAGIGQMAIDSFGRLFVGSINGDALNVLEEGAVDAFYPAPGLSPRAVCIDAEDNVYLTCAADGVMRKLAWDGTVLSAAFASGLQGAISQAIAPAGVFRGNLFVACGDRVMEVDISTGQASTFLSCQEAHGIAFDPEGFMHLSIPSENRILRIMPNLPGDMNGDALVNLDDMEGFALALLQEPDAPLPIIAADMNADGCADGRDVQGFVDAVGM